MQQPLFYQSRWLTIYNLTIMVYINDSASLGNCVEKEKMCKKQILRRGSMSELNVTDLAVTKLQEYMQANNIESALRVALMQGGWAGPSLGLALDEPKDNDKVFENDTLKFLVEDSLMSTCGGITVDYVDAGPRSGFGITSVNPISTGGGCSSGSCGDGSCGWFKI